VTALRAVQYLRNRRFEVGGVEARPPGPDEVAIDIAYTGICGTDLHIFHGAMDQRVPDRLTPGHETSGVVAAIGDGVDHVAEGDHVVVRPLDWCGECRPCRTGSSHICYNLKFLGIDVTGSMQERWVAPARVVYRIPPDLPLDEAALVEPLAVAVHDVRRSEIEPGDKTVVIGGGPIGQLIALVARDAGGDVAVSEPDAFRRSFADESGFATIDPLSGDLPGFVDDWTGGDGADLAFEVSGSAPGALAMTEVLAGRGRAVVVGIYPQPVPVDLFKFFWRELTLVGSRVYADEDFREAIDLIASGRVEARRFLSATFPMERATEAYEHLDGGGGGLMKVLVESS